MKTDIYDSLVEQIEKVEDPDLKKNYTGSGPHEEYAVQLDNYEYDGCCGLQMTPS